MRTSGQTTRWCTWVCLALPHSNRKDASGGLLLSMAQVWSLSHQARPFWTVPESCISRPLSWMMLQRSRLRIMRHQQPADVACYWTNSPAIMMKSIHRPIGEFWTVLSFAMRCRHAGRASQTDWGVIVSCVTNDSIEATSPTSQLKHIMNRL